ncbi:apolipoprotein N-acyltransferase [Georgenia sp. TF02-10]|uniref:apolipoprotein N-acyltransferase n=1 Tax=Georgenia sp. TF02-10 TaxID=2917725 RepID=UPI001FA81137|nr:apolipoprotein N-acyltransferase [Georgenia sp. TF02-10]UNX53189.1 apolipoprotein N-acyltransferase [Georgenia sp. TF02-10]
MPRPVPSRLGSLLLAAAGGVALWAAFPRLSWWPLAYLGVALLLLALRRDSAWWGWLVGFVAGLAFFLPLLRWADEAVGEPIGWVALSVAEAAAVGVFGAAWVIARRVPWVARRPWLQAVLAAVVWVAVEQLRGRWPFGGFPWGLLAFSQADAPVVRLAAWGGTPLVSGVVVLVGALLAAALVSLRRARVGAGAGALVVAGALAVGPALVPLGTRAEAGTLRLGAVQGNVPTQGAEAMSQARAVAANHAAGTVALAERAGRGALDLVVWPESASDIDPRTDPDVAAVVDRAAAAVDAPLLLGTQRFFTDTRYNDYLLWQPGVGAGPAYTKQHPVPFGEYIPYRDFFRTFTSAVDLVSLDMAAGTGPGVLAVPVARLGRDVPVAVGICFEVAYDDLIADGVRRGGELIVVPTNNASFGRSAEAEQQLAISRFRAVEHGRTVVQVSTVGVSGIVGPDGTPVASTGLFTAEEMTAAVPLRTSLTWAARLGGWPAAVVQLVAAAAVLAGLVAGRGRRGRGPAAGFDDGETRGDGGTHGAPDGGGTPGTRGARDGRPAPARSGR